jgi:hypothetical protein
MNDERFRDSSGAVVFRRDPESLLFARDWDPFPSQAPFPIISKMGMINGNQDFMENGF